MARLTLDLLQATLDALTEIAIEAQDPRFTNPKGMIELRLKLEAREHRIAKAVEAARLSAEAIP